MKVKTTFLCGIDQIELHLLAKRGERFADNYFITKERELITELIYRFGDGLGSVETNYLINSAKAVVYRSGEIEHAEHDLTTQLEATMIDDMLALKLFSLALWRVKDNAGHFDRAWIVAQTTRGPRVHCNSWASRVSSAGGSFEPVTFSSDELRIARNSKMGSVAYLAPEGAPTMLAKDSLRFQRFMYFLGAARDTNDVAMKIAQYCSGLEALVSTSQQELSHQVAERVAGLLASPGPDRISIFKLVKQAYGFRSKAVHGASFKPRDVDQLRDCAIEIDQIYRKVFDQYLLPDGRIRSIIEDTNDKVTSFFEDLVIGGNSVV